MGTTAIDNDEQQYACKCLNIRFRPAATQTVAAELNANPDFIQVFVVDEGIIVAHPQVTVRTRTRGVHIAGTTRSCRYTTITCLVCDLVAYRVYQTYTADIEGKEGPLLPTEDWVERDVLKSSSGLIEVNKQCLSRDAISQALLSPHYSAIFRLLLPPTTSTPPASAEPTFAGPSSPHSPTPPSPSFPKSHFAHLRPAFLPPPFTPSHPIFAYFSTIASNHSEAVRSAAEQHINDLIQSKVSAIERGDAELRRNVEALWKKFREGVNHVQEQNPPPAHKASGSRSGDASATFAIRDFVPAPISPARSPSSSVPRMSALSASLATSSFPYPRTRADVASYLPDRPSSAASDQSNESRSSLTLIVAPPQASEGSNNVLKFKRNINDTINTEASYRYFVNLEEDVTRRRKYREEHERKEEAPDQSQEGSPPNPIDEQKQLRSEHSTEEATISRGREKSKGKRKVTFDVEPEVVTIKREVNTEIEEDNDGPRVNNVAEMIFELEDLDQEPESPVDMNSSLPLVEPVAQPLRTRKHRQSTELSGSFSNLRPASLPAPSHIRPPRGPHGADTSSPTIILSLPRPSGSQVSGSGTTSSAHAAVNSRDVEILKLVAANTPSHRGAWKPNSKAWQTFVRRQDNRDHSENRYIAEEGEEEGNGAGSESVATGHPSSLTADRNTAVNGSDVPFVGSLPIPIKFAKRPQVLSLASYRPQTAIPEQPVVEAAPNVSRTALRKAVYAERDRSRSIDPGALDFEEEEEKSHLVADDEAFKDDTADAGDRGRNRALKILQAGSEIPEAGMWRSLAA
ncbi:hypothetical protein L208DRAFT_1239740 [Tricholoma matsutake]|nr:hypothetical protein L208DRAFT_1239740 [Tricholoma matsutake 945]